MEISVKDVKDFSFCPRYYDLVRDKSVYKNEAEEYDESLHKTFYSTLYSFQNNTLDRSMNSLKVHWSNDWIKNKSYSRLALARSATSGDTHEVLRQRGINAILNFDAMLSEEQFAAAINRKFKLKIAEGLWLNGSWEYIREIKENGVPKIQLMIFDTGADMKFRTSKTHENDIALTAAGIAFDKTFNGPCELIHVDTDTWKMVSSELTEERIREFYNTVKSVAKCIKHNIRCVSRDRKCFTCEYREVCGRR